MAQFGFSSTRFGSGDLTLSRLGMQKNYAAKGFSGEVVKITDMSGKHPAVPMKPRGAAGMKNVKTESGDPQRAALAATVRGAVPEANGKHISILV